eukprot:gnl/Spiro4/14640_TR7885_c0_g1_i1.p1 gnl/Spiro4/14640_TR7885_c0_g1~~gnl/Spiro4/14640_TR7885_c0_g1_i1.p1  ORF type:complete len:232 (+),score=41.66 gnl/Spiro4/14640_TR7885_c0_g1_i1:108-803(+)
MDSCGTPWPLYGVLFDLDGTLCDTFELGFQATSQVLRNHGLPEITSQQYQYGCRYPTPQRLAWHVTGSPDRPEGVALAQMCELLCELSRWTNDKCNSNYRNGDNNSSNNNSNNSGRSSSDINNNSANNNCKLRLGALSNACGAYVRTVLQRTGVEEHFAVACGADDVPAPKPYPDGLLHIVMQSRGAEPRSCPLCVCWRRTDRRPGRALRRDEIDWSFVWLKFGERSGGAF